MLQQTDILTKLSAPNANAGNSQAGIPGYSWGNYMSFSPVTNGLDNLFLDLTGPQNTQQQVDYACLFIHNNTSSFSSMTNVLAWLPLQLYIPGPLLALAADPVGVTSALSNTPQAVIITSAVIAPPGVTGWQSPVSQVPSFGNSYAGGIQLPNIGPQQCTALWVQRTAVNSGQQKNLQGAVYITYTSS
jgi:hypothetical protein